MWNCDYLGKSAVACKTLNNMYVPTVIIPEQYLYRLTCIRKIFTSFVGTYIHGSFLKTDTRFSPPPGKNSISKLGLKEGSGIKTDGGILQARLPSNYKATVGNIWVSGGWV